MQMKVKMVTADDDQTVDILMEGDVEEILRMAKVCARVRPPFEQPVRVYGSFHPADMSRAGITEGFP